MRVVPPSLAQQKFKWTKHALFWMFYIKPWQQSLLPVAQRGQSDRQKSSNLSPPPLFLCSPPSSAAPCPSDYPPIQHENIAPDFATPKLIVYDENLIHSTWVILFSFSLAQQHPPGFSASPTQASPCPLHLHLLLSPARNSASHSDWTGEPPNNHNKPLIW